MKSLLVVLVAVLAVASADLLQNEEWEAFKLKYGKMYKTPKENLERLKNFLQNKRRVLEHNKLYAAGEVTYKMGLNEFSDMSTEQLTKMMQSDVKTLDQLRRHHKYMAQHISSYNLDVPNSIDWRDFGAVTAIKGQNGCAACYAFAALASLESLHFIKTGKLIQLSEQNLIDCTRGYANIGCRGGWIDTSYDYIKDNGGINSEAGYPYQAYESSCRFNSKYVAATVQGYRTLRPYNETEMMHAVATVGPIATYMYADSGTFMNYQSGIYKYSNCPTNLFTHTATIVGYGTDPLQGDYWIMKNSWKITWGEKGYFRIARNENLCGIASAPIYPIV